MDKSLSKKFTITDKYVSLMDKYLTERLNSTTPNENIIEDISLVFNVFCSSMLDCHLS